MEVKNIGQLIQHLATKAGIEPDNEHLKNVLSNAELSKVTVHSDLVTGMDNALLSIEQAGNNHPQIKKKYDAQVLNAVDKRIEEAITSAGLSDEKAEELRAEKSTYKRLDLVIAAIKDAADEKAKTTGKDDQGAHKKQVDELLQKLRDTEKQSAEKLAAAEAARRSDLVRFELRNMLAAHKTVFDDLAPEAKQAALDAVINKALQDKEASFDLAENNSIVLRGKEGTTVVRANNTAYTPQSFIDETLANNKLLKVTEAGNGSSAQNNNASQQGGAAASPRTVQGGTAPSGNNQATANLNRQMREAAAANAGK